MDRTSRIRGPWLSLLLMLTSGCGAPAFRKAEQRLSHADAEVRREAARDLGRLGAAAAPATPSLVGLANDPDPQVRQAVCRSLGEIGTATPDVIGALQSQLADAEWSVQLSAAFALQKLQPEASEYHSVLTAAMQRGEGGTIVAIGKLGPAAAWALPTLTKLLRDPRPGIRRIAADAIGEIGPDEPAAAALRQLQAKDGDDRVREAAQQALVRNKS